MARRQLPVRAVVRQAGALWLATRAALVVFTYFAVPFNAEHPVTRLNKKAFPPHSLLAHWNQWDTGWYIDIAVHGYHDVRTTGFFPLYPMLIHTVCWVIGFSNALAAALIVSNLGALAAFIAVGLLAAHEYSPRVSLHAVRILAAFPAAFFLAAGYADSLFVALAVFALLFARRGQWPWAALCAFLASLDRQFGVVLILPLLWECVRQRRAVSGQRSAISLVRMAGEVTLLIAAVPAGLIAWGAYLYARFGDPFSTLNAQRTYWGHYAVTPWRWLQLVRNTLWNTPAWTYPRTRILFDLAPVVAAILITTLCFRRWPLSLAIYMLGIVVLLVISAVPLDFDPFTGDGRYVLMCAPMFLLLGRWASRRPGLEMLLVAGGFMLQGLFLAFFLRGGWLV